MASATIYSRAATYYHWAVAVPLISSVACVLKAIDTPKEQAKEKGEWMWYHKSLGCLTGMIVLPRVGYRLFSKATFNLRELPGTGTVTPILSKIVHYGLYGFMTIMPLSGIAMGLYGGKGVPFFWTTIPGFEQKNGKLAGQNFKIHKFVGEYGKYLIPIHAGAAVGHAAAGQKIFARINPFRGPPMH